MQHNKALFYEACMKFPAFMYDTMAPLRDIILKTVQSLVAAFDVAIFDICVKISQHFYKFFIVKRIAPH